MGRRSKTWGEGPGVDDPGRASAIRDHSYTTSNGTWQLPKDSEVDREIARLANQMAAELEITDRERDVVAGSDSAGEADDYVTQWEAEYGPVHLSAVERAESRLAEEEYAAQRDTRRDETEVSAPDMADVEPPTWEYIYNGDEDEAEVEA